MGKLWSFLEYIIGDWGILKKYCILVVCLKYNGLIKPKWGRTILPRRLPHRHDLSTVEKKHRQDLKQKHKTCLTTKAAMSDVLIVNSFNCKLTIDSSVADYVTMTSRIARKTEDEKGKFWCNEILYVCERGKLQMPLPKIIFQWKLIQ